MHRPHKPLTMLSACAGAAALMLMPFAALAQGPGAGPGMSQPGQVSPGPQQPGSQQEMQQTRQNNQQMDQMEAHARDSRFVRKALAGDMAEVQLGQLALQKGSSPEVKQFAQKMIDDHTKLSDNMKPVAEKLGVSAPTKLDKKAQRTREKLDALSGTAFDHAYMKDMVKDHKQDLQSFKQEAASTQDPAVKTAADQGAQVISAHLQEAEQIASQQTAGE